MALHLSLVCENLKCQSANQVAANAVAKAVLVSENWKCRSRLISILVLDSRFFCRHDRSCPGQSFFRSHFRIARTSFETHVCPRPASSTARTRRGATADDATAAPHEKDRGAGARGNPARSGAEPRHRSSPPAAVTQGETPARAFEGGDARKRCVSNPARRSRNERAPRDPPAFSSNSNSLGCRSSPSAAPRDSEREDAPRNSDEKFVVQEFNPAGTAPSAPPHSRN